MKNKVLFVCIHNSARSQMAEAFLDHLCPESFEAHSAGVEPGTLNPMVVEAMHEAGLDISHHRTKSVDDMLHSGHVFSHVVTVCDAAGAERCPMFPGGGQRLHWGFPDPSALTGTHDERMARVREIRDMIQRQVKEWCDSVCAATNAA
jgi:arsenate reductase